MNYKINSFEKKYFLDLSDKFLKNLSYINSLNLNIRNQGFPKNITFVLGMHRSGTSALTGLLCKNKIVGFPEEKLEVDEHNQKGYWELKSIFINNDQLLRKYNLNWESINELPPDWIYDKHYPEWQNNFIEIIKKEFNGINKPIIKDPRLTYLFRGIKNWNESDELNFNILIPVRVPFEVIESIMVRKTLITSDKHNHFKFLEFYIENLFEVELSTRYMNRLFIDFEDLINKPNLVLNKCNIFFGNELHKIIKNYPFISKDLRHQNYRSRINNKNKRNFVESKLYKLALDLYKIFSSSYMNENAEVSLKKILKLKKEYFINYKKQKIFSE